MLGDTNSSLFVDGSGSSPLVGRQHLLNKQLAGSQTSPTSSDSLSTFKRPSTSDELGQSQSSTNVDSNATATTSSEIRSMKTMSVYHHNQSSDSEDEVMDPNQLWKPSGLLQKASSNADISNNPDYGHKSKPSPNPRVHSSRDNMLNPPTGAGSSKSSTSSSFGAGNQPQGSSTFSTFGSSGTTNIAPPINSQAIQSQVSPNKPLSVKVPPAQHGFTSSEIVPMAKPVSTFSKSPAASVGLAGVGSAAGGDAMWRASIPSVPELPSSKTTVAGQPPHSPVKVTSPSKDSIPVPIPKPKPAPPPVGERSVSKAPGQNSLASNNQPSVSSAVNKESPKGQRKFVVCPPPKPSISKQPHPEVPENKMSPTSATSTPLPAVKSHSSKSKSKVPNLNDDLISPPPLLPHQDKVPSIPPKPSESKQKTRKGSGSSPERRSDNLIKPSAFKKAMKSQEAPQSSQSLQKSNIKHGHSKSTIDEGSLKASNLKKPQTLAMDNQPLTGSKPDLSTATDPVAEIKSGVSLRQSVRRPQIATLSATETEIFADVDLETLLNIRKDIEKSLKIAVKWDELNSNELSVLCAKLQRFHECCKNYSMVDLKVFTRRKFTEKVTNLEGDIETLRKSAKITEANTAIISMLHVVTEVGSILGSIDIGSSKS